MLGPLFDPDGRFLARISGVLRFESPIYREIETDPNAIPQSFAVVIVTALLAGLGQGSLAAIFLGIATAVLLWILVTGLVWGIGVLVIGPTSDFPRLLRGLGFAYVWFALMIGSALPGVGWIFSWAAVLLYLASLVLATREMLETSAERALLVCGLALGIPLLIGAWLG